MKDRHFFPSSYRQLVAALGLVGFMAGCESRPSALPLQDGTVYSDNREGFRFFVPEGWRQQARGTVPRGKLENEQMLAEYRCMACAAEGTLLVTVADVPLATSLSEYVTENTRTGDTWRLVAPAEEFTVNGVPAARITHVLKGKVEDTTRETVAIRRGERVYFFKGTYGKSDGNARQVIRTAVDTIVW